MAGLFAAALAVRLPDLDSRPVHTDEANNAYLLQEWLNGRFRYRAHDHHGPLLFHIAGPAMRLAGVSSVADMEAVPLRLVSVIAGLALVISPLLFRHSFGQKPVWIASALLAVAAPFAYYNGIFIHESLLLACLAGFVAAFWKARESGALTASALAGVFAGFALATKETAAPILILFALCAWPGTRQSLARQAMCALVALVVAFLVTTTLFSTFWKFPRDAFALFKAVGPQVARGTGQEHSYPWFQYLTWYLGPSPLGLPWAGILLTVGGIAGGIRHWRNPLARTLFLWALALVALFSALSYKTPWLALVWLFPLALLTGLFIDGWLARSRAKALAFLCATVAMLALESRDRCLTNSVESGNVFAYSPSSRDLERLEADLGAAIQGAKDGRETLIQVVAKDYWPLPWLLRRYRYVGYWSDVPTLENDAIVLLGPEYADAAGPARDSMKSYSIRPGTLVFLRPQITSPLSHQPLPQHGPTIR